MKWRRAASGQACRRRSAIWSTASAASAAKRAKLGSDYRVTYLEQETSNVDRLIGMFGSKAMASLGLGEHVKLGLATTGLPADAALGMAQDLSWLSGITREHKPFMALTHCLCEVPLGGK